MGCPSLRATSGAPSPVNTQLNAPWRGASGPHYRVLLEDRLERTDDVQANLNESRHEIAAGNYTTRQPD